MATRGAKQLQKMSIRYCEVGGSSLNVREFLSSGKIVDFAAANPTVEIEVTPRNGHHPYIRGDYMTGNWKQMCVKNEPTKRIRKVMEMLNNTSGRKIVKLGGLAVRTDAPSVQGIWTPMLELPKEPFEMQLVHSGKE